MKRVFCLTLLALVLSGCSIGGLHFGQKQCEDRECFDDALIECALAKYFPEKEELIVDLLFADENSIAVIEGKIGEHCKLKVENSHYYDMDEKLETAYCYQYYNPRGELYWRCKASEPIKTKPHTIERVTAPVVYTRYTTDGNL